MLLIAFGSVLKSQPDRLYILHSESESIFLHTLFPYIFNWIFKYISSRLTIFNKLRGLLIKNLIAVIGYHYQVVQKHVLDFL